MLSSLKYVRSPNVNGGTEGLGRPTNKDQPGRARTSWLPLSKGRIDRLLDFSCLGVKENAQRSCPPTVELRELAIPVGDQ
jgi:hypothetical protein